jgi:hypothetical protein
MLSPIVLLLILVLGCLFGGILLLLFLNSGFTFTTQDNFSAISIGEVVVYNGLLYQVIGKQWEKGTQTKYVIQRVGKVGKTEVVTYKDILTYRQLDCTV